MSFDWYPSPPTEDSCAPIARIIPESHSLCRLLACLRHCITLHLPLLLGFASEEDEGLKSSGEKKGNVLELEGSVPINPDKRNNWWGPFTGELKSSASIH